MRSTLVAVGLALLVSARRAPPPSPASGRCSFRNSRAAAPRRRLPRRSSRPRRASPACRRCRPGIKPPPGLPGAASPRASVTFAAALATAQKVAGLSGTRARKLRANALFRTRSAPSGWRPPACWPGADKGALAALLLAAERNPRDPLPLIDAAALLIDAKKPNEALALLAQAAELPQRQAPRRSGCPRSALLETNRAAAYFRTGQYALAVAAGRRALRASTWLVEARENVGMALLCQGRERGGRVRVPRRHEAPAGAGRGAADAASGRARPTPDDFGYTVAHARRLPAHRLSGAARARRTATSRTTTASTPRANARFSAADRRVQPARAEAADAGPDAARRLPEPRDGPPHRDAEGARAAVVRRPAGARRGDRAGDLAARRRHRRRAAPHHAASARRASSASTTAARRCCSRTIPSS